MVRFLVLDYISFDMVLGLDTRNRIRETRCPPLRDGRPLVATSVGWWGLFLSVILVACGPSGPSPGALEKENTGASAPGPAAEMAAPTGSEPSSSPTSSRATAQPALVDEAKLRQAFASASSAHQLFLEEALAVSRVGQVDDALEHFQKLLKHPGLTPQQQAAIHEAIGHLQARGRLR